MSSIQLPSFIPWILVGTGNGLLQGAFENGFNTLYQSSWPIRGLLYGLGGILALGIMDLVAMLFPSWRASQGFLPSNKAASRGRRAFAGVAYLSALVLSGFFNGMAFWALMSLNIFRNSYWLGTVIVGMLSLLFYSTIASPLISWMMSLILMGSSSVSSDIEAMGGVPGAMGAGSANDPLVRVG